MDIGRRYLRLSSRATSEAGSEEAEPSPGEQAPEADKMYENAARDLADKGAADPEKEGTIAQKSR